MEISTKKLVRHKKTLINGRNHNHHKLTPPTIQTDKNKILFSFFFSLPSISPDSMIMNHLQNPEAAPPQRLCDFCSESTAVVFCRADAAKLCLACDRQVHSTNPLFTKHSRWLLCDSCDSTPATIFCRSHASVMCQNCDWEAHQRLGHERRPLEGFSGCPSASELVAILGFDELGKKLSPAVSTGAGNGSGNGDGESFYGFSDFLVWETPSVVSLDDLIRPDDSSSGGGGHSFQSIGVPPLPKNRNATCGQYKEEILSQIREMSKLEPNMSDAQADVEPLCGFQFLEADQTEQSRNQPESLDNNEQPKEANSVGWFADKVEVADQDLSPSMFGSFVEMNNIVPDKESEFGDSSGQAHTSLEDPGTGSGSVQVLPRMSFRELNSQERDSALTRYKEKKKTRRYEKHIRYETRKVRAESRTRIRGRFAKKDQS